MSADYLGLREQILANARLMVKPLDAAPPSQPTHGCLVPSMHSAATLTNPNTTTSPAQMPAIGSSKLEVVIFGHTEYTAAIMVGITPAIEGASGATPEAALRKLLLATCELLHGFMPKVGAHQRNIHNGGVFDEDTICVELMEAQRKSST
ncbi:unnamed protein product [Zymoseptoria tritici ST99CH_1A5]|uniref:Uncharacterized protein n=2 Tax=Zymoseptoria tritici TaxID=1047171 RepID=A0A1X7RKZ1_ZYMT9|nr:unnamed protein product [Zymoseptoria tritici ST99CH_3D7]SMR47892.1 unnamed protein product [Zymoseptoria tritici ST99CH_3D1]SMY21798.1 unnamed protein product [Zymoseptoria tritici ST99CH_1A5]